MLEAFFTDSGTFFSITLFVIGVVSGFVNAVGGSGGLIISPFMIGSGIPPALALGSARVANIVPLIIALKKFNDTGKIEWDKIPLMATISITAGIVGTFLIIGIDEKYIYPIIGTLMLLIAPIAFLKKDLGLEMRQVTKKSAFFGYIIYFLVMIYGGFFGAGASIFVIFTMVWFLGLKIFESHVIGLTSWVFMSVISSILFIYYDQVDYYYVLILFISMSIGSYIGSHYAIKAGDIWIKRCVCLFAVIIGIKILIWG